MKEKEKVEFTTGRVRVARVKIKEGGSCENHVCVHMEDFLKWFKYNKKGW